MNRPIWCDEKTWETAVDAAGTPNVYIRAGSVYWRIVEKFARAIMAEREAILAAANVYVTRQYGIGALGHPIDRGRVITIRNGDAS
jgi:chloramphenicol 3-O-phosphotransferase